MVEWKKLEEVCEILDSQRKPVAKGNRNQGIYPYYGANGIQDYVDDYIFDGTFLLLGEDGSVINKDKSPVLHWATGKIWVNNHAHILKENNNALLRFIFYILQCTDVSDIVRGVPPKINQANMRNIQLPVPSISEQKRIAGILDTFTASIDNLKKQIFQRRKQYEYYRDQLLDLEGKEGVEMKISDFCLLKAGKSISANEIFENRIGNVFPCIGGNGIRGYVSSYSHEGSYPVIGRQGALCGCVNWIAGKFYATEHAVVATGKKNTDQRFLYYLFENADLNQYKTQGAQPGLSVAKLNEVTFLIPSLSEQQRIVSILDTFEASIQNLEAQLSQREKQYEYYRNKLLTFE